MGMGSRERGNCLTLDGDTPFLTGAGELVLAVTTLAARKAGLVDIDAPITDYLPDLVLEEGDASGLTLRRLLDGTSGLPDAQGPPANQLPLETYVMGWHPRLWHTPGALHRETQDGPPMAALALERASGKPYPDLVRELVFGPLEMNATFSAAEGSQGAAVGTWGFPRLPPPAMPYQLYASARDLAKLARAIVNSDPILGDGASLLFNAGDPYTLGPQLATGLADMMGWPLVDGGWFAMDWRNPDGYSSGILLSLTGHAAVVVLTNDEYWAGAAALDSVPLWVGSLVPLNTGPRVDPRLVGTYEDPIGVGAGARTFHVTDGGSSLFISGGGIEIPLVLSITDTADVLEIKLGEEHIDLRFWRDAAGNGWAITASPFSRSFGPPPFRHQD